MIPCNISSILNAKVWYSVQLLKIMNKTELCYIQNTASPYVSFPLQINVLGKQVDIVKLNDFISVNNFTIKFTFP